MPSFGSAGRGMRRQGNASARRRPVPPDRTLPTPPPRCELRPRPPRRTPHPTRDSALVGPRRSRVAWPRRAVPAVSPHADRADAGAGVPAHATLTRTSHVGAELIRVQPTEEHRDGLLELSHVAAFLSRVGDASPIMLRSTARWARSRQRGLLLSKGTGSQVEPGLQASSLLALTPASGGTALSSHP